MTVLKTTWSNGYDPLLLEHWSLDSTPGVVLKKKHIFTIEQKDFVFLITNIVHFTIQQKDF